MQRRLCLKRDMLLDPEKVPRVLSHPSHPPDEVSPYPCLSAMPSQVVVMQNLDMLEMSDKRRVCPRVVGAKQWELWPG